MKKLGCWIVHALTVLSLLLCSGTVGFWVRSYRTGDYVSVCTSSPRGGYDLVRSWRVMSAAGGLEVCRNVDHFVAGEGSRQAGRKWGTFHPSAYPFFAMRFLDPAQNHLTTWQRLGFEVTGPASAPSPPSTQDGVIVPYWAVAVPLALLALVGLRAAIRARRRRVEGRCPQCSYDLTGNVSGVCPECGSAIAEA